MSTPDCLSCSDSPLAIAGSVVTFATLAYGLLLGLLFYWQRVRNAPDQLRRFANEFLRITMDWERCRSSFEVLRSNDPAWLQNVSVQQYETMMIEFGRYNTDIQRLLSVDRLDSASALPSNLKFTPSATLTQSIDMANLLPASIKYYQLANSLDKLFEIMPKARLAMDGAIDAIRELEARYGVFSNNVFSIALSL